MKVKVGGQWGRGVTRFKRQGSWLAPRSTWQKHDAVWRKIGVNYYLEHRKLRHYATGIAVAQHYDSNTSYGMTAYERRVSGRDCVDFYSKGWIKMTDVRLPSNWTINLWYYARNFTDYHHFFTFSGDQTKFTFKMSPTYPGVPYIHYNGNTYRAVDAMAATGWQMVTLSYDGSSFRIYINGVLSVRHVLTYAVPQGNYLCGSINESDVGEKNIGLVSDLVIYDKLLSQADITELFNNW